MTVSNPRIYIPSYYDFTAVLTSFAPGGPGFFDTDFSATLPPGTICAFFLIYGNVGATKGVRPAGSGAALGILTGNMTDFRMVGVPVNRHVELYQDAVFGLDYKLIGYLK